MRRANLQDLHKIFDMVWRNIDTFALSEPDDIVTFGYLQNLIMDDDVYIMVNEDCTAAMGFEVGFNGFSMAKTANGIFLVSGKPKSGIKLAKQVLEMVKSKGLIPIVYALPKLSNFYRRVGLVPRQLVFSE